MTSRTEPTILRMASPLVISFVLRAAVTFVDTIYAALLGDTAVAAVGLTVPFEFLMIAVWVGISTGLTSALSRAMGAGEHRRVEQYRRISWWLVGITAPVFTILGAVVWFAAPRMGLEPALAEDFRIYGTVLIAGSAWTTFWSIIPDSLVKAHQDTRATMWAGICTNIVNVVLNSYFLFVLDWGVFGIALSTVVGRIAGLVYAIYRAEQHERRRRAEAIDCGTEDRRAWRSILGLAVPASLTFALMATESGLVNGLLTRMEHATAALAAYSIYYRVMMFAVQPSIAISVAMLPFAARRFGRGDVAGARKGFWDATLAVTVYSVVVVGPLLFYGAPFLAGWLTETELTRNYATFALRTVPLGCLSGAGFLLCRPMFEALNRGHPGLVMALFRYVVLTGPLAYLGMQFARPLGQPAMYGLIAGLLVAAAISSGVFYLWLRSTLRQMIHSNI